MNGKNEYRKKKKVKQKEKKRKGKGKGKIGRRHSGKQHPTERNSNSMTVIREGEK